MQYKYTTKGTCSRAITFDIDENEIVSNISFTGGCNGNLKGIASLTEGMKASDIIKKVKGLKCGFKNTSCPDQFALALEAALNEAKK